MTEKSLRNILIIKLGYCETLANEEGFTPSLGDVFRHTALLHHYKNCRVTWLTSKSAMPLLAGNPYIHELIIYEGEKTSKHLQQQCFDEILCLEKAPVICEMAKKIKTSRHLGFGWNGTTVHPHPLAEEALTIAMNGENRETPTMQAILYKMVGSEWEDQDYILGYKPKTRIVADIGLNYRVGSKWPTKAWPMKHWQLLEKFCVEKGFSVSWQKGADNLYEYMDWINSLRLVVTCDSLGMHLGLALKKWVVALFGPTPSRQIHMYGMGTILHPGVKCRHEPCMLQKCDNVFHCMETVTPHRVFHEAAAILGSDAAFLPKKPCISCASEACSMARRKTKIPSAAAVAGS